MCARLSALFFLFLTTFSFLGAEPLVAAYPMHRSCATDQSLVDSLLTRFTISKSHLTSQNRIARWQEYYLNDRYHLRRVLHNMSPFIPLMIKGIDTYGLPGEIALIPVIESCYRPAAVSVKGAQGLWQINAITAQHLELHDRWDYQACFDIQASTQAAMSYLADLHDRFGSWPLALAAYNVGPQALQKALMQTPYRTQRDLEQLPLPEQTKDFVAKIQALAQILQHYEHYGVVVPSEADPLVALAPKLPLDVRDLMLAFDIPLSVIEKYNPALSHYKTPQAHRYHWLIPESYFRALNHHDSEMCLYQSHQRPMYQVQKGDNLTHIARRFGLSLNQLMQTNNLEHTQIFPNQLLWIPPLSQSRAPVIVHQVLPGESLWSIAQRYGACWQDLQDVNELPSERIKPNQTLLIPSQIIKNFV